MSSRNLKSGYFVLEALNSFAVTFYFYYFYFLMRSRFEYGDKANLVLAAANGCVCMVAAWWGGRFAQRAGCFTALKLGFSIMLVALLAGTWVDSPAGHIVVMLTTCMGMCFTWATLEALVSEGETRGGLQRMVGIYNVVWAATGALAYFTGGAMLEKLGMKSLFYIPAAIVSVQLALTFWLQIHARSALTAVNSSPVDNPAEDLHRPSPARAKAFLRMAWLANPFAYMAINTLVAAMPGVAARLGLTPMQAGFCGSVWCFVRFGAFFALWFWPGWHYRFRWLLTAFVTFIGAFALILLAPNLAVLVVAQLFFGAAIGLIYYSSLFYSMDVGETKSEHGGIHEAAIGLGNMVGPSVGAASLHCLPQYASSGVVAVSILLVCGLGGLLAIWQTAKS